MVDAEHMPAVILAGGMATRLRPVTERIPKALIEVAGRPFLWHQLQLLKQNGIRRVVLLLGYLGEQIQAQFGDGSELGMEIDYSFDGPKLLGTAGAICKAMPRLPESFFVLYGDSYLTCPYRQIGSAFARSGSPAMMTIYRNDGQFDGSNVEYDGERILRYDKQNRTSAMKYIDYGLGVFSKNVFAAIPAGEVRDLASIYQDMLEAGKLAVYEVRERFYEIGSPEGLAETAKLLEARTRAEKTIAENSSVV